MAAKKQKPVELTPIQKAHLKRQELKEQGIEVKRKNPLEKFLAKPTSRTLAVNARCFQCVGEDQDPGYRQRIGTCSVTKCALHAFRPYQRDDNDDEGDD